MLWRSMSDQREQKPRRVAEKVRALVSERVGRLPPSHCSGATRKAPPPNDGALLRTVRRPEAGACYVGKDRVVGGRHLRNCIDGLNSVCRPKQTGSSIEEE